MRILIPDVLTDEMIDRLLAAPGQMNRGDKWNRRPIPELVEIISAPAPVDPAGDSYWRVETRAKGHPPHYDGCQLDKSPNHMPWCSWSAVSLLTPPAEFTGGEFKFHDPEEVYRDDLYKSLLVYSSGAQNNPQLHEATPHQDGDRTVLLMFMSTK